MEYVDEICKMLNMDRDKFIEYAVERAISSYLNEDGKFAPERGILIKSDETDVVEREECIILGKCSMMGHDYLKIFVGGGIKKVPEYVVTRT